MNEVQETVSIYNGVSIAKVQRRFNGISVEKQRRMIVRDLSIDANNVSGLFDIEGVNTNTQTALVSAHTDLQDIKLE